MTHSVALHAALCILLLVARYADDFLVTWDETLVADGLEADLATEALLVPLLSLVLEFLHPYRTAVSSQVYTILAFKAERACTAISFSILSELTLTACPDCC